MAHSINGMAERLREKLATPGAFPLAGCYDVLSAMLLRQAGFSAIFLSGYGVAASLLGNPDIGLTSLSETAAAAKNTIGAVHDVPIIVDADNGYGNEDNVIRTVYELEYAGAAGMIMRIRCCPKRCGHTDDKEDPSAAALHAKARMRAQVTADADGHRGAHRLDGPRRRDRARRSSTRPVRTSR